MKNLLKSLIFAFVFMLSTCGIAKADSAISLNRIQTEHDSIEISMDNVESIVNSFQVSLKIEGSAKLLDIEWSDNIKENARANFKYNKDDNVVDIYVTSKENLVSQDGELVLGTLKVEGPVKGSFNVVPNTAKSSGALKLVSNNYKETVIDQMDVKGESKFTFPDNTTSGDVNKPGDSSSGNTNTPGDNNSGDTSKPEDSSNENIGDDAFDKDENQDDSFVDVENEILCGEDHDHSDHIQYENVIKEGDESKFVVYGGWIVASLLVIAGVLIVSKKMK